MTDEKTIIFCGHKVDCRDDGVYMDGILVPVAGPSALVAIVVENNGSGPLTINGREFPPHSRTVFETSAP